jgi:dienelactone hydrolase
MPDPITFTLDTPDGPRHGLVDLPAAPGERPVIVILPDSSGLLDWAFLPYLATLLAARGFVAVRIDGEPGDLPALLDPLLEAIGGGDRAIAPGRVDPSRLGLFGHGRGGSATVLTAALPEWHHRSGALVTWATPEEPALEAASRIAAPWLLVHGEVDATVPVAAAERLFAAARGPRRKLHLLPVPGGDHTFGARHPWTGPTPALIQALNATQRWFRRHLS